MLEVAEAGKPNKIYLDEKDQYLELPPVLGTNYPAFYVVKEDKVLGNISLRKGRWSAVTQLNVLPPTENGDKYEAILAVVNYYQ